MVCKRAQMYDREEELCGIFQRIPITVLNYCIYYCHETG